jgi:polar amino acid transport system permease protein
MRSTASRTHPSYDTPIRIAVTCAVFGLGALFLFGLDSTEYDWAQMVEGSRVSQWASAFWTTLWLSMGAMVISLVLGVLGGLARMSRKPVWNQLGNIYVACVRSTPLLIQILFAYFVVAAVIEALLLKAGMPQGVVAFAGNTRVVGIVTLGVFAGAYVAEIVRAAVESIDRGQTEAALSQGMSQRQAYRHVVFPQALRRMLPPLAGQFISLIKDSSLLMILPGVIELTQRMSLIRSRTYRDNEPLLIALTLYFVLCFGLSLVSRRLETRLAA